MGEMNLANPVTQWSDIKTKIRRLDKPSLLGLVKDLFEFSSENRNFLTARFVTAPEDPQRAAPYRRRIAEHFYPKRGWGSTKTGPVRKIIREYRKATADAHGVLDLMLFAVEKGTEFTNDFGDIDEPFYDGMCAIFGEFDKLITHPDHRHLYPGFAERLKVLAQDTTNIGWGYGDYVSDIVAELEQRLRSAKV